MDTILGSDDNRCFYEMIREGMPCKMYFDVEWVTDTDADVFGLSDVQAVIADLFTVSFPGRQPGECVVLRGSRVIPTGFKHSYHLVYPSTIFACNNGQLKRFAALVASTVYARFGVSAVDLSVYSKDRAFRAPLCHKLLDASRTPLLWDSQPTDLRAQMLLSMVSCVSLAEAEADVIAEDSSAVQRQTVARQTVARQRGIRPARASVPVWWVTLLCDALQRFLAARGGRGVVQRRGFVQHSNGSMTFRYEHRELGVHEPCLRHGAHSRVSHRHDNQFVTLTAASFVFVSCPHGSKCAAGGYNHGRLTKMGAPILESLRNAL